MSDSCTIRVVQLVTALAHHLEQAEATTGPQDAADLGAEQRLVRDAQGEGESSAAIRICHTPAGVSQTPPADHVRLAALGQHAGMQANDARSTLGVDVPEADTNAGEPAVSVRELTKC